MSMILNLLSHDRIIELKQDLQIIAVEIKFNK